MNNYWQIPEEVQEWAVDMLRDLDEETVDRLMSNPNETVKLRFSGVRLDGSFDKSALLEAGNARAIKAYIKGGDHYNLALVCSAPLRKQAQRAMVLRKFGDLPKASEFWPECTDYFYVFSFDEVANNHDEDDEWVLTPRARAISDYVHGQFRIYDNACDFVFQATTRDGEQLYHGPDRLEMYKAIYKELVK